MKESRPGHLEMKTVDDFEMKENAMRLNEREKLAKRRRLDVVLVCAEPNILALTGIRCDNAVLVVKLGMRESGKVGRWESGKV